ncbi:PQ-loop repeat-containing protein 1 [Eurytemora carolleeae]|uniref:PQ-loop repeat-containing protein 1 n=1 Tax=Eurytemora carolleeae TaxID=1294199 RepID=UPI000C7817E4|nr:PQ-loop repeat-containing protein 1 [Eurytemora carolleeae]|eukprot:XP_023324576.1 PQ-loop repeat-containing protein 1-like [Eurytemora affinis]
MGVGAEHGAVMGGNITSIQDFIVQVPVWFPLDDLLKLITFGCEVAIMIGGVVPFIPQYIQIKSKQTTQGFSLYVCLALLLANTLRAAVFEVKSGLSEALVFVTPGSLVGSNEARKAIHKNHSSELHSPHFLELIVNERRRERVFTDLDLGYFWAWTDFTSYLEFIMSVAAIGAMFMYFLLDFPPFVETVGFLAVFMEAMLGVPQFYRNFRQRSTYGMSLPMVCMWTTGDVFKTSYFYLRNTPAQFFICGSLQVCVDLMILSQVWMYRESTMKKKRSEHNMNL